MAETQSRQWLEMQKTTQFQLLSLYNSQLDDEKRGFYRPDAKRLINRLGIELLTDDCYFEVFKPNLIFALKEEGDSFKYVVENQMLERLFKVVGYINENEKGKISYSSIEVTKPIEIQADAWGDHLFFIIYLRDINLSHYWKVTFDVKPDDLNDAYKLYYAPEVDFIDEKERQRLLSESILSR